jgi:integrative and conjugative element protein (TIGR02256 family)
VTRRKVESGRARKAPKQRNRSEPGIGAGISFRRAGGRQLLIGPEALRVLREHTQFTAQQPEAGGVLIGRHLLESDDIVVDTVTSPMPGDRQSRYRFFRARARHQAVLDEAWRSSAGTETYLGEWHTHPEVSPTPSGTDWREWQRKLRDDRYSNVLFFVIVGTHTLSVWEGTPDGTLEALLPLDDSLSAGRPPSASAECDASEVG